MPDDERPQPDAPRPKPDDEDKDWKDVFVSKTFWTGVCVFALSGLTFLQGEDWVKDNPRATSSVGMGVGVLMVALRFLSEKSVRPVIIVNTFTRSKKVVGKWLGKH